MSAAHDHADADDDLADFAPPPGSDPSDPAVRKLASLRDLAHRLLGAADGSRLYPDDMRYMPLPILEGWETAVRRRIELIRSNWESGRFDRGDRSLIPNSAGEQMRELDAMMDASRRRMFEMESLMREAAKGHRALRDRLSTDPVMVRLAERGFGTPAYAPSLTERMRDWLDARSSGYLECVGKLASMDAVKASTEETLVRIRTECVRTEQIVAKAVYDDNVAALEDLAARIGTAAASVAELRHDPDAARMARFFELKKDATRIRTWMEVGEQDDPDTEASPVAGF